MVTETTSLNGQAERIRATPVRLDGTTLEAVVVGQRVGDLEQTLVEVAALLAGVVAVLVVAVVALSYAPTCSPPLGR